ncbi:hypothetical protein K3556_10960 [Aliiroseovarius sp. M344]|uniref:hypothetical protein n=1 Tax=Aliiroseovarius sp. M344 TaxID=2867010 RepID=UPI0021ADB723|nr:hypothetical protein [Aliiroseovarius sp. M344]UWQ13465.1 hypothetical protein K3556_10960 [Aliiroseovarius sp. M344]
MHTATYFDDQQFLYVSCAEHVHFASLTASIAEWIIAIDAPKDRSVLVDLRRLRTIDRPTDGTDEYIKLQKKLSQDYQSARKLALLATRPETFVLARIFEQSAQDQVSTEIEVFRNGSDALAFLGIEADDVDDFIRSLGKGQQLG